MGFSLPSGVVNTNSAYFVADATLKFGPLVKEPSDQTLIVLEYGKVTPAIVIDSFSFTVDVSSNPELVVAYAQLNSTGTVLTFLLSGGIVGQQYNITIACPLSGGGTRTDVLTINLPSYGDCDCIGVNPVPQLYSQLPLNTQGYVNTGVRYFWGSAAPANPNVMDQWYNTTANTLYEWTTDGTEFLWQPLYSTNLVTEAPQSGVNYIRYNGHWAPDPIQADAPSNSQSYVRNNAAWALASIQTDAPSNGQLYGRQNNAWTVVSPPAIAADAPSNGQLYGRQNNAWTVVPSPVIIADAPSGDNAYLRMNGAWSNGGTLTGSLSVQNNISAGGALNVSGNVSITGVTTFSAQVALPYDPISALQAVTKQYVDNKFLTLTGAAGSYLPLSGGMLTGALTLAADPGAALQASTKQYVDGRTPITIDAPNDGQVYCRQNDGWVVSPSGGMTDAPNNAYVYMRGQQSWQTGGTLNGSLTINGVTTLSADPAAPLQAATKQYCDARFAQPSSFLPLMDGTAAVGAAAQYARGDHVHPTDTSRYAASNPSGYVNTAQAAAAAPVQSVAGRTGAVTLTHNDVADWAATLAPYALLASPTFTGTPAAPTAAPGTNTTQLATTAFVAGALSADLANYLPLSGGTLTGNIILPALVATSGLASTSGGAAPILLTDPPSSDSSAMLASTRWVTQFISAPANMTVDCGSY